MSSTQNILRRRYSDAALGSIPKLLQLIDRNPYSPTYGCFDRSYWHYRTMDFPCGMYQEFCLPLALVYQHDFPDNPYYHNQRMRELALAGVDFARRSAHPDGSCDDYFPFERALGAMVFSLYACTETCLVLDDRRAEFLEFFSRRGRWLIDNNESGQLANHQAFAALALHNVFELTDDQTFAQARDKYLDIVESWQSDEGWFQEYEGADPGYHSCSIAFLAKLYRKTQGSKVGDRILKMLRPAVDFAWYFMHPDGSYAGEYGSRNTYHFYPHGFEVMARHQPKAAQIADQFLNRGLPDGKRYFNEDDRMCAHYVYDWLQSYLDYCPERAQPLNERENFTRYFEEAKILVKKSQSYYLVLSLAKGGVLKLLNENGAIYSDTGLITRDSQGRTLVSHLVDDTFRVQIDLEKSPIVAKVSGQFSERKTKLATPFRQILFRILNLTIGRISPDLLRSTLQKILITGKARTNLEFTREFQIDDTSVQITNEISHDSIAAFGELKTLHIGSDATSIYVANSNVYQHSVLCPWQDHSEQLQAFNKEGKVRWQVDALDAYAKQENQ